MARLVIPRTPGTGQLRSESVKQETPDAYTDRLVKYIPVESIAFYTFVDKALSAHFSIVAGAPIPDGLPDLPRALAWVLIVIAVIGTPVYIWKSKLRDQPWVLHAVLSTIAFGLWAYALGGAVFVLNGWYNALLAGLLAPIFTFVAGWFEPRARTGT